MRRALLVSGLLLGTPSFAQQPAAELSAPPVLPTEAADPALPPVFFDQALRVDSENRITQGRKQTPLTHRELFVQMGRTDLLAQSEALASKRKGLIVASIIVSSTAIAGGLALIATAPKLASIQCESSLYIYNEVCVPRAHAHNISGTAIVATGVVGALLMAGFAFNSDPRVLGRDETAALVSTYNSKLARELRRPPAGLRILPVVTPDGAAVTALLRF